MDTLLIIILTLAIIMVLIAYANGRPVRKLPVAQLPPASRSILQQHVAFYQQLDAAGRQMFESRVQHFLSGTRITGVNTIVEDLDKVLIASGAIIPIFAFPDWEYINLNEVLLYPDAFDEKFSQEGEGRDTAGLVGAGAFQRIMILSKKDLRKGFLDAGGKSNTAIHEFVHLLDKTDGETDGIPEVIMHNSLMIPWLELMKKNIQSIRESGSDIDAYGATSSAEFLAVISEYFFEKPGLLQSKHPELYNTLVKIFRQKPKINNSINN